MALTRDQIINSSAIIDDVTKHQLLVLFRSNEVYKQNVLVFSTDVASRIDAASGTIKGRMLNALATKIDELGTGVVQIKGDDDGVYWNQESERQALVTEALRVLYEDGTEGLIGPNNQGYVNPDAGLYGCIAVGQRSLPTDACTKFMCGCGNC